MAIKVDIFFNERLVFNEGVYEAMITSYKEHTQFNRFVNTNEVGVRVGFTIMEGEYQGKMAFQFFTAKLAPKSNLTKLCAAVMARPFTPEELAKIVTIDDIQPYLLYQPVKILIRNRLSQQGVKYYAVDSYLKSNRVYDIETVKKSIITDEKMHAASMNGHAGITPSVDIVRPTPTGLDPMRAVQEVAEVLANIPDQPTSETNPLEDFSIPSAQPK